MSKECQLIIRCAYRYLNFDEDDDDMLIIKNRRVQECRNRLLEQRHADSSHSLLSESDWFDKNGSLDDQIAIAKISDYIKQNWNLEKYMFTVKKTNKVATSGSTCHTYEVNLNYFLIKALQMVYS